MLYLGYGYMSSISLGKNETTGQLLSQASVVSTEEREGKWLREERRSRQNGQEWRDTDRDINNEPLVLLVCQVRTR